MSAVALRGGGGRAAGNGAGRGTAGRAVLRCVVLRLPAGRLPPGSRPHLRGATIWYPWPDSCVSSFLGTPAVLRHCPGVPR